MTILGKTADLGVDITSIGLIVGTMQQVLPDIAAILSIIWLAIRIWETNTVRGWRGKKPMEPEQ